MQRDDARSISPSIKRHIWVIMLIALALIGGLGSWAMATTLAGAVVANGSFVVDSYVKQVQHPTGGIVGEILVQNGDRVESGDVLLRLDATQTQANLAIVVKRLDEMAARLARLQAERDDLDSIVFPDTLLARTDDPDAAAAMRSEQSLFSFRQTAREGQKAQLRERIEQYRAEVAGLETQAEAFGRALAVTETEIADLKTLFDKNLVSVQRLNALEREAASLEASRGEVLAHRAQALGKITETELQILQIDIDLKTEVGQELREVQVQIGEYVERRITAEDALHRIDLVAPQDGIVHQLAVHTVGGVINAAEVLMEIVPDNDSLALDANVSPADIDQIHLGQPAIVRLSAFNQRTTPELNGWVNRIAADAIQDERTGRSFYRVRITVSPEELERLQSLTLVPGMPAEAFIQTGERTPLSYLIKPLSDQINRAFREE